MCGVGAPSSPMVVIQRAPSLVRPTTSSRHDDFAAVGARERQRAERDRPAPREPDFVVARRWPPARRRPRERQPGRDASPGQAGAVLARTGSRQRPRQRAGRRRRRAGRCGRSSACAREQLGDAPRQQRALRVGEPRALGTCRRARRARAGRPPSGKVSVGVAVGEQPPMTGHDRARSRCRGPSAGPRLSGVGDLEQRDSPAGPHDASELGEERRQLDAGCAARTRTWRRRRRRRGAGGAARRPSTRGAPLRSARSIPSDRSTLIGSRPAAAQLAAQVAGARREVEHDRAAGQARASSTVRSPPADVHPERHDPVHEVVARSDGVEHRPHRADLLLALGQWRVTARDSVMPSGLDPNCAAVLAVGVGTRRRAPALLTPHDVDLASSQPANGRHQHADDRHEDRDLEQVAHQVIHAVILPAPRRLTPN